MWPAATGMWSGSGTATIAGPNALLPAVLSFLHSHPAVTGVQAEARQPTQVREIEKWEKVSRCMPMRYTSAQRGRQLRTTRSDSLHPSCCCLQSHGLTLPSDLKSLYAVSDGLSLRWSVQMRGEDREQLLAPGAELSRA